MTIPNAQAPTPGTFRTSRILPWTPAQVFEAFARPERLARWWGPDGFTNTFDVCDFTPGGRWTFVMHGPNDARYPNENVFRDIQPPSTIVIDHVSAPQFTLTVTLTPHATGTALSWVQRFDDPAVGAHVAHIVEPANEQNLDRLTAVLAAGD